MNIFEYLNNNSYPGRGIIIGEYDNKKVVAYFIMGRSDNSRNRVFRKKNDILYTEAYDISKVKDPSLIIYYALRKYEDKIIVSNGDQTDTIYEYLKEGKTFKEALDTRIYEPDEPNFTPRISGLLDKDYYLMGINKKNNDDCLRNIYKYEYKNNVGHFISTYDNDGSPLPSFSLGPIEIEIDDDIDVFSNKLWNNLNLENKISLYVRYDETEIIFNKNEK